MFLADLMRAMAGTVTCDFIAVSSYGSGTQSSGEVRLLKDLDRGLEGRDVIIVEDIVDTGLTLAYLQEILRAREPQTLETACLLSKPSRRKVDVPVDYIGFTIEDRFVVGLRPRLRRAVPQSAAYRAWPGSRVVAVRKFGLISETEARQIEPGSTVELEKGGHVTPLAWDTLARAARDGGAGGHRRRCVAGGSRTGRDGRRVVDRLRPHRPGAEGRARRSPAEAGQGRGRCRDATRPEPVDYPDIAARGRQGRGRAARPTPAS